MLYRIKSRHCHPLNYKSQKSLPGTNPVIWPGSRGRWSGHMMLLAEAEEQQHLSWIKAHITPYIEKVKAGEIPPFLPVFFCLRWQTLHLTEGCEEEEEEGGDELGGRQDGGWEAIRGASPWPSKMIVMCTCMLCKHVVHEDCLSLKGSHVVGDLQK